MWRNVRSLCHIVRLEGQPYLHDSKSILRPPALRYFYLKDKILSFILRSGETPHSFRVGISYTLKGLDCTPEQIAQYVGWRSTEMALYYTRRSSASASLQLLERVTLNLTSTGSPPALQLSDQGNLQRISYSWISSFLT